MQIIAAQNILKANEDLAEKNRARLDVLRCFAVNIVGSPGAGKTALLEALLPRLRPRLRAAVIEGDLATANDAARIESAGTPAVQINTGGACHLDANMVARALDSLAEGPMDLLFIENVGNLVCTAGFDLGERLRLVVLSVAEGDDKVEKYPPTFQRADAVVLSKIDLLNYTDFDPQRVRAALRRLSPQAELLELSAKTGHGINALGDWLIQRRQRWLDQSPAPPPPA